MQIRLGTLRRLIREAYYDLHIDQVKDGWSEQLEDAVEFIMCHMRVDAQTAQGHVLNNWVFDTLEHEGKKHLIARDEATGDSLAYVPKMGGWYYRLGDNDARCRQTGTQRGTTSARAASSKADTPRQQTGTAVSGEPDAARA